MISAAAVCPHPPLLVPEVAAGAAHELDDLRAACRAAVETLAGNDVVVVGTSQAVGIGRWLLPSARVREVAPGLSPAAAAELGRTLTGALLVMGDGSARRSEKAPGHYDPRAEAYDVAVAAALRAADPQALLDLDPALDTELLVAGRPAWQVLAGAALGGEWRGEVLYEAAPYGVGYVVATWSRA